MIFENTPEERKEKLDSPRKRMYDGWQKQSLLEPYRCQNHSFSL